MGDRTRGVQAEKSSVTGDDFTAFKSLKGCHGLMNRIVRVRPKVRATRNPRERGVRLSGDACPSTASAASGVKVTHPKGHQEHTCSQVKVTSRLIATRENTFPGSHAEGRGEGMR